MTTLNLQVSASADDGYLVSGFIYDATDSFIGAGFA